ncbi:hypothetical protein LZ32DRAFT_387795 [Colletotrichum eremochloae]|nr:hypothetical protein LZ32DRAFT_387795 [Colletotrichum eremochloae]
MHCVASLLLIRRPRCVEMKHVPGRRSKPIGIRKRGTRRGWGESISTAATLKFPVPSRQNRRRLRTPTYDQTTALRGSVVRGPPHPPFLVCRKYCLCFMRKPGIPRGRSNKDHGVVGMRRTTVIDFQFHFHSHLHSLPSPSTSHVDGRERCQISDSVFVGVFFFFLSLLLFVYIYLCAVHRDRINEGLAKPKQEEQEVDLEPDDGKPPPPTFSSKRTN